MIKAFDKQNLKALRADIDAAFEAISKKHGVNLSMGTIRYAPSSNQATAKLTMIAMGDASTATDPRAAAAAKAQAEFKIFASSFGLKPEQYGATFTFGRDTYKLVALNPRASKNPIHGTNVRTGKTYIFRESAIVSLQSKEHKEMFGITSSVTPTAAGMCSNDNAYDDNFNPIGKCTRPAVTTRREGFPARTQPYCQKCANLIDESRSENAAEARCS